ncbi:MAG: hypothetical protein K5696_07825 [Lachnospiraceae bacterium]|nr:hypothetical protein [Lachnospiraceae bacterium]
MEYTGLPVTIADIGKVTLKVGTASITGDDLKNNFTVSYADNTATGQATVILTAKKGTKYCGSSSVTFTITKKPFGK